MKYETYLRAQELFGEIEWLERWIDENKDKDDTIISFIPSSVKGAAAVTDAVIIFNKVIKDEAQNQYNQLKKELDSL